MSAAPIAQGPVDRRVGRHRSERCKDGDIYRKAYDRCYAEQVG